MFEYLSDDLIAEIFERLPVKSLLKFRYLSKSWYSRISSTDFIRKHTLRPVKANQKVVIRNICPRRYIYTLHSEDQLPLCLKSGYQDTMAVEIPGKYHFVGSCNGILCLLDRNTRGIRISLWNYSIQRIYHVPDHPYLMKTSSRLTGFGFDRIKNDYKVVVITCSTVDGGAHDVCVYSLGTDSWTVVDSPTNTFYRGTSKACFVNGTLHWVVISREETVFHHFIMTFNLSSHVFNTISLPQPYWTTGELTIINGSLAVISSNFDETWIWVRKESNNVSSWSMAFKLKRNDFHCDNISLTPSGGLLICCVNVVFETIYVESLELLDKQGAYAYGEIIRSRDTKEIEVQ